MWPLGVLTAAQPRGAAGLPRPHPGWRSDPGAAGAPASRASASLPVGPLCANGGAGPGGGAAAPGPAHRRQPGLLAPRPQGGVLEPDEAHRTQRCRLRRRTHPSNRRLDSPTHAEGHWASGPQQLPAVTGPFLLKGFQSLDAVKGQTWLFSSVLAFQ